MVFILSKKDVVDYYLAGEVNKNGKFSGIGGELLPNGEIKRRLLKNDRILKEGKELTEEELHFFKKCKNMIEAFVSDLESNEIRLNEHYAGQGKRLIRDNVEIRPISMEAHFWEEDYGITAKEAFSL